MKDPEIRQKLTFSFSDLNSSFIISKSLASRHFLLSDRQNRPRFVYESCDPSPDKSSFDFADIFHAMQNCAINAESRIILRLPKSMVT